MDASSSHANPPAGVAAEPALYGLYGARLESGFRWGSASAWGRLGSAFSGSEGRWVEGGASLTGGRRVGPAALRIAARSFGLRYLDPFTYDAAGVDLRPTVSLPSGRFVLSATPVLSAGSWSATPVLSAGSSSTDRVEGRLSVAGGDVAVTRTFDRTRLTVDAGAVDVVNGVTAGTFLRGGGALSYGAGSWRGELSVRVQRTPLETAVGGTASLVATLASGVEVHVGGGHTLRDPLFGAAGTWIATGGVAIRPIRWAPPAAPTLVRVGERTAEGRRVRFALRAEGAERVEIAGDFSNWRPLPMEEVSGVWQITRFLAPGVHHFGFLVDGEWAMPADAPGLMDDGWGRQNASIVIEP